MTTLSSVNPSTGGQAVQAAQSSIAGDMQSFMQLLVAQLQNQDPLAPVDSTQFVTQLAMFAQAEQGVNTNRKLDTIVGTVQSQMLSTSATLLGRTVMVPGGTAAFDGAAPVSFTYTVPSGARSVSIEIVDASGRTVRSVGTAAAPGAYDDVWDGLTADGGKAEAGLYTIRVSAEIEGEGGALPARQALPTTVSGKVEQIRVSDGGVVAVVAGEEIPLEQISSVGG
jgi:flagellar basal-body rod modification protein FlgD